MHKTISTIQPLAQQIRETFNKQELAYPVAARASGFALASSAQRSIGTMIIGVQPDYEKQVSTIPSLIKAGRYLQPSDSIEPNEIVIGHILARNLKLTLGDVPPNVINENHIALRERFGKRSIHDSLQFDSV